MDLSVIVVSYNTADLLRRCLRSIRESIRTISYEVIVVDNASRDGSADLVESEFPWVRLWRNRENVGFAKANNLALTLTRSRYVLLLNPDTIVVGDALERMVAFMEAHPDAGVLGCRVLDGTGKVQASTRDHYPNLWRTLLATVNVTITGGLLWIKLRERLNRHAPCWQRLVELSTLDEAYAVNRQTCVVTGCCLMARRSVFERVGLLDEHFFFGGEEMEWCYRVRKAGFEIWFTAEAEIVHYGKQSLGGSPMHRVLYYQNAHYHLGKHYGRMAALVYRLVLPLHPELNPEQIA